MSFTVPTTVVSKNSAGSVTSTAGTFTSAVAAGTALIVGISVNSDTPTISSVADSKGNAWSLVGHEATAISSPVWIYSANVTTPLTTSDTLTVTISSGAVINFIGVAGPGTVFIPFQFTGGNGASAAAFDLSVPGLPTAADGFMVAFSVNGSAAPTWLTPGPTVLTTISGGGGPFFSCAYEDADDFPATLEIDMSPNSTASMASTAFMSEYTDNYTDLYSSIYGQFLGTPWPQSGALALQVDLKLNGTWTDITDFVYQRDGSVNIAITHGRPDESSKIVTAQCKLQLNNRGGVFSPKNSSSNFYPYITRNTQIRVLVPVSFNDHDAGRWWAFSGEVSAWPPSWDLTGNDVWVNITASGITRRLNQKATLGSALSRWYLQKSTSDPLYPVAYWPAEDGANSSMIAEVTGNGSAMTFTGSPTFASDSSFAGSDPIPALNGSSWQGLTGSYADPGTVTYTSPGTHIFQPRAGLTSLTAVECWGGGGGGTNGYQANGGKDAAGGGGEYAKATTVAIAVASSFAAIVGAGGAGGGLSTGGLAAEKQNRGADGGTSSFAGDSVTVTAHGGGGGLFTGSRSGAGGTGSSNTTHHNGAAGGKNSGSFFGGSGGGSSGGSGAAGNAGSNGGASNTGAAGGAAVTNGGAGGKGGNGGSGVDVGGTAGSVPGGGGGSGGENSANQAAHSGGNGGAGKVKLTWTPLATPAYNVVRFLLHVPSGGDTNNAIVAQYKTSGKVATVILTYTTATGGSLTMTGKDSGGGLLFTSGTLNPPGGGFSVGLYMISMELVPGATIGFNLSYLKIATQFTVGNSSGTASASGSVGVVTEVDVNPAGGLVGTSVGHVLVQYSFEDMADLTGDLTSGNGPINGWNGELAGQRFVRLCAEEGIQYGTLGNVNTTAAMGPQPDDKLINVLQQVEDLDGGLLIESPLFFGLEYRCLSDMRSQSPALIADYSKAQLSQPFQPTEDDQLTRNDVTVTRNNGSSYHTSLTSGALSTLDPPDGVGEYTFGLTVNAFNDSQLPGIANRILTAGTVDDYRYPQVNFQLSRSEVSELMAQLTQLAVGDRIQVLSPPSFLTASTIDLIVYGFAVTISAFQFDIELNCVPESPFG